MKKIGKIMAIFLSALIIMQTQASLAYAIPIGTSSLEIESEQTTESGQTTEGEQATEGEIIYNKVTPMYASTYAAAGSTVITAETIELGTGTYTINGETRVGLEYALRVKGNAVLDLGNNRLICTRGIIIENGGSLTLKNGTVDGNYNDTDITVESGGKLIINGGNVGSQQHTNIMIKQGATFSMTNGTLNSSGNGYKVTNYGTVNISGGSLKNMGIENYGTCTLNNCQVYDNISSNYDGAVIKVVTGTITIGNNATVQKSGNGGGHAIFATGGETNVEGGSTVIGNSYGDTNCAIKIDGADTKVNIKSGAIIKKQADNNDVPTAPAIIATDSVNRNNVKIDPNANITGTRVGLAVPVTITETPALTTSLTYNGTAQSVLATNGSVTGGTIQYKVYKDSKGGDVVSDWNSTLPTVKDAGTYFVTYKVVPNDGYIEVAETDIGTIAIAQKPITVTASDQTIVYGAEIAKTNNQATVDALENGDTVATIILTASDTNVTTTGTITPSALTLANGAEKNYSITYQNGKLTITKAKLDSVTFNDDITPIANDTAKAQLTSADGSSTATITWTPSVTDKFAYNTEYKCDISIAPSSNHEFDIGATVAGMDGISFNLVDGHLTGSKTFPATAKAKITDIPLVNPKQRTQHYETADELIESLPKTVTATTESGELELQISWKLDDQVVYNNAPNAKNKFVYTHSFPDEYDQSRFFTSVWVEIQNAQPLTPNHSITTKEVAYNGQPIDIKSLFTLDENTSGATVTYTVVKDTGDGTFDSSKNMLTVTKAGTFTVTATTSAVGFYGENTVTDTLTVTKGEGSATVSIDNWIYGEEAKTPVASSATNNGDPSFTYSVRGENNYSSDVPTTAGAYTVKATFATTDLYNEVVATADFEINRATPSLKAPTGVTATYGQNLGDITLINPSENIEGAWSWTDDTQQVGDAGTNSHTARFTPTDSTNYNSVEGIEVSVEVKKAQAPIVTFPTAVGITYGDKLSSSSLTGGSEELGTFAWTSGNTIPNVVNSGYEVTFTPSPDTIKNYEDIPQKTATVAIAVAKANVTVTPPTISSKEYDGGVDYTNTIVYTLTGVNGEIATMTFAGGTCSQKNVGDITVSTSGSGVFNSDNGMLETNYNMPNSYSAVATRITQKPITAVVDTSTISKQYDGNSTQTIKYNLTGANAETGVLTFTDIDIGAKDAGAYEVSPVPSEDKFTSSTMTYSNYAITVPAVSVEITAKPINITVTAQDVEYKATLNVTMTSSEIVAGENINDIAEIKYNVAPINVGEYKATAELKPNVKNYTLRVVTEASFNITQAPYGDKTAIGLAIYGTNGTVDLSSLICEGGILGEISVTDTDSIISGTPSISANTLSFAFVNEAKNVDRTATVTIPVTSKNYQDYNIILTLKVIKKNIIAISGTETKPQIIYGTSYNVEDWFSTTVAGGSWIYVYGNGDKPTDVGEYTVTATYENTDSIGTATVAFSITPKNITHSSIKVGEIQAEEYTGAAIIPEVVINDAEKALVIDTDYTVEYQDNTNAGTATIIITGKGNYGLTLNKTFTITPKAITPTIADIRDEEYTGSQIKPSIKVNSTDTVNGYELIKDTDYIVTYGSNLNVADGGSVAISSKEGSNYKFADVTARFKILPIAQAELVIGDAPAKVTYGDKFIIKASGGSGNGKVLWSITDGKELAELSQAGEVAVKGVGKLTITATKLAEGNYKEAVASLDITVNKKAVTVKASDLKMYSTDKEKPALIKDDILTYDGFINDADLAEFKELVNIEYNGNDIVVSAKESSKYEPTFTNGKLTVIELKQENVATPTDRVDTSKSTPAVEVKKEVEIHDEGGVKLENDKVNLVVYDEVTREDSKKVTSEIESLQNEDEKKILSSTNTKTYEINLIKTSDNTPVKITKGKVKVFLPYPSGVDSTYNIILKHYKDNNLIDVDALQKLANGVSFETDSFGPFIMGWEKPVAPTPTPTPTPDNTPSYEPDERFVRADKLEERIKSAKKGEIVRAKVADDDIITYDIMRALADNDVRLVIEHNGKKYEVTNENMSRVPGMYVFMTVSVFTQYAKEYRRVAETEKTPIVNTEKAPAIESVDTKPTEEKTEKPKDKEETKPVKKDEVKEDTKKESKENTSKKEKPSTSETITKPIEQKKSNIGLIVAIVIAIIAVAGIGVILYLGKKKD